MLDHFGLVISINLVTAKKSMNEVGMNDIWTFVMLSLSCDRYF